MAKKRSKRTSFRMERTHVHVLPGEVLVYTTCKELSKFNTKKRFFFFKWARDVKRGFIKKEIGRQIGIRKDGIGEV